MSLKKGAWISRASAPNADEVKTGRSNTGMSSEDAGEIIGVTGRQWRYYEAGQGSMNPQLWLLFCIRTGQVKPDV